MSKDELYRQTKLSNLEYLMSDVPVSLKTTGRSRLIEDFNVLEYYLTSTQERPNRVFKFYTDGVDTNDFNSFNYENYFIREKIIADLYLVCPEMKSIFSEVYHSFKTNKDSTYRQYFELKKGYVILHSNCLAKDAFTKTVRQSYNLNEYDMVIESITMLYPDKNSENYDSELEEKIIEIHKSSLIKKTLMNTVSMISIEEGELFAKEFVLDKKVVIKDLDLHYGENFTKFNSDLLKKLKTTTKGLVLLHGDTGTGKSYYIRYLLQKLIKYNKNVLYFPPLMVDAVTDPNFVSFISSWSAQSDNNLLLIEDAEPLLASREEKRNIGITNLLNLTDGILNDIFKIQIIATFNTSSTNLDDAILRPERLVAQKKFDKLSVEQAKKLAESLRIDTDLIDKDMSLAEIYSIKNNTRTIKHNVKDKNQGTLGFQVNKDKKIGF